MVYQEQNIIFSGGLGEYKYYDMDKTIEVALEKSRKLVKAVARKTMNTE